MLHLITGLPGASKSLNALRELVNEKSYASREIYYNNIKLLMLDFSVVESFEGWFYGVWLPSCVGTEKDKYIKVVLDVHKDDRYVNVDDVPHLQQRFQAWFDSSGFIDLWLYWVRRVYPDSVMESLNNFLAVNENPTKDQLQKFNLDFRHFHQVTDWYNLPNGSVILVDECQHWFPPRGHSAKVPRHVSEFETHRHKGFDVYLITQNAKLLDNNIRRLAGRHIHYQNNFGTPSVTRFETQKVTDFDEYFGRQSADKRTIRRDKNFYGLYHSADVHTHRVRIPKKVYVIFLTLLFVIGAFSWFFYDFTNRANDMRQVKGNSSPVVSTQSNRSVAVSNSVLPVNDISAINSFQHPLRSRCTKIEYAGSEKIKTRNQLTVKHYINCFTGDVDVVDDDDSGDRDSDESASSRRSGGAFPVIELLSANRLSVLGYEFTFVSGVPVLIYSGNIFALANFN